MIYRNRKVAAEILAEKLKHEDLKNVLVMAVPGGGIPIGYEISKMLKCPMEIFLSEKIVHPVNPAFTVGAVTLYGWSVDRYKKDITEAEVLEQVDQKQPQLVKRFNQYMGDVVPADISNRTVILVDDGVATGSTMASAVRALKKQGAWQVIVAVPVSSREGITLLKPLADKIICPFVPLSFLGIAQFYQEFSKITDEEGLAIVARHRDRYGNN